MATNKDGLMSRHKDVVHLLEKNLKYLESVGVDPSLIGDYKRTIAHLKSRTLVEVMHILATSRKDFESKLRSENFDERKFESMSLEEVSDKLSSPKTTRAVMERIAISRFGMTKGGLSSLHNREALKSKLLSMLNNESAHRAISSVVRESVGSDKPAGD
nr:hypothetical protein [Pseudomonas sp.]